NLSNSLYLFDKNEVKKVFIAILEQSSRFDKAEEINKLKESFDQKDFIQSNYEDMFNKSLSLERRIDRIRFLRNYNDHTRLEKYIALIKDKNEPVELRVNMTEALGWFVHSYKKEYI